MKWMLSDVRQDMMRPERRTVMSRGSSPGRLPGGIWEEPKKRLITMWQELQ